MTGLNAEPLASHENLYRFSQTVMKTTTTKKKKTHFWMEEGRVVNCGLKARGPELVLDIG